jgi:hypothetical protein
MRDLRHTSRRLPDVALSLAAHGCDAGFYSTGQIRRRLLVRAVDPPRVIFERVYVIARAISSPTVFETDAVKAALNMFAEEGSLPVWAGFNGEKILYYPTEPFASAIVDPSKAESRSLAEKALAWRKRYGVD